MVMIQSAAGGRAQTNVRREAAAHAFVDRHSGWQDSAGSKRLLDVLVAGLALIAFAPIMGAIFIVLLLSGGKPIFVHRRVGRNGRYFSCYKFRSMASDADAVLVRYLDLNPSARAEWDRAFKLADDPRVTSFGAILRRMSLDELPQLFNVLKGDMSLVGPRPIVTEEVSRYGEDITAYYHCLPGMTGLWQVSGRNNLDYAARVRLDSQYARERSVWLDLSILLRTPWAVVTRRGAL